MAKVVTQVAKPRCPTVMLDGVWLRPTWPHGAVSFTLWIGPNTRGLMKSTLLSPSMPVRGFAGLSNRLANDTGGAVDGFL